MLGRDRFISLSWRIEFLTQVLIGFNLLKDLLRDGTDIFTSPFFLNEYILINFYNHYL